MITLGIIGCGYWGPNLVRNFHGIPGARVKTVSDLRPGRLESIRGSYPQIATTHDHADVIGDAEIDAVVIATPVETHHALAVEALEARTLRGTVPAQLDPEPSDPSSSRPVPMEAAP